MPPRAFGRYEVVEPLERGGMAEVFRARDTVLDRMVAVKVLHGELSNDHGFVERFHREAKLVATLRHQHIVQIYDFGVSDGDLYMVMEFLDGGTLKERLARLRERREVMSLTEIAQLLGQLAGALDYAHSLGAVHRDIKPGNIMFRGASEAVITDFGVAKMLGDFGSGTVAGSLIGSPAYMSPEQAAGKPVDARSDLYSLGVVVYQMAAGRVPFESSNPTTIIMGHINQPTPPPRAINPALPETVQHVILRSMAKDPSLRYASATEMAEAFRTAIRGLDPAMAATDLARGLRMALERQTGHPPLTYPPGGPPPGTLPSVTSSRPPATTSHPDPSATPPDPAATQSDPSITQPQRPASLSPSAARPDSTLGQPDTQPQGAAPSASATPPERPAARGSTAQTDAGFPATPLSSAQTIPGLPPTEPGEGAGRATGILSTEQPVPRASTPPPSTAETVPGLPVTVVGLSQETTVIDQPAPAPARPTIDQTPPPSPAATVVTTPAQSHPGPAGADTPQSLDATLVDTPRTPNPERARTVVLNAGDATAASSPASPDPEATVVERRPVTPNPPPAPRPTPPADPHTAPTVIVRRPTAGQAPRATQPSAPTAQPQATSQPARIAAAHSASAGSSSRLWLAILLLVLIVALGVAVALVAF